MSVGCLLDVPCATAATSGVKVAVESLYCNSDRLTLNRLGTIQYSTATYRRSFNT